MKGILTANGGQITRLWLKAKTNSAEIPLGSLIALRLMQYGLSLAKPFSYSVPCGISWLVTDHSIERGELANRYGSSPAAHSFVFLYGNIRAAERRGHRAELPVPSKPGRRHTHTQERKISSPYMERSASFRWINPSRWSHAGAIRQSPQRCVAEGECV